MHNFTLAPDAVSDFNSTYTENVNKMRFSWEAPLTEKGLIARYTIEIQLDGQSNILEIIEFNGTEKNGDYLVPEYCRQYLATIYAHTSAGRGAPRHIVFTSVAPRKPSFAFLPLFLPDVIITTNLGNRIMFNIT